MPYRYPRDDDPNVPGGRLPTADVYLQDTRWLAIPVTVKDGIANCYLSGTGVADFTDDPDWVPGVVIGVNFSLRMRSQSPLELDDVYTGSAVASVGLAHVDYNDDSGAAGPFQLALDTVDVSVQRIVDKDNQTKAEIWLDITGAFQNDCWMDKIAFKIGLLVFRPSFLIPPPKFIPRHLPIQDLIGLVQPLRSQM